MYFQPGNKVYVNQQWKDIVEIEFIYDSYVFYLSDGTSCGYSQIENKTMDDSIRILTETINNHPERLFKSLDKILEEGMKKIVADNNKRKLNQKKSFWGKIKNYFYH